jgi:hypothetical protein
VVAKKLKSAVPSGLLKGFIPSGSGAQSSSTSLSLRAPSSVAASTSASSKSNKSQAEFRMGGLEESDESADPKYPRYVGVNLKGKVRHSPGPTAHISYLSRGALFILQILTPPYSQLSPSIAISPQSASKIQFRCKRLPDAAVLSLVPSTTLICLPVASQLGITYMSRYLLTGPAPFGTLGGATRWMSRPISGYCGT